MGNIKHLLFVLLILLVIFGIYNKIVSASQLDLDYEISFDEKFNISIIIFNGNNFNEVFQIGDKNFSFIFQEDENNEALINQEGSENSAVIRQSSSKEESKEED